MLTFRCPYCAAPNRYGAAFCLECGEPLDDVAAAGAGAARARAAGPAGGWLGREALIGMVVLCGLAALALLSNWRGSQDRQGTAYARGVAEQAAHHWLEALAAFRRAGDYADAPQRLQATDTLWATLQHLDAGAARAEHDGAWWDAAATLRDLAARDPQYPDVAARLARADAHTGVIIYRVPHGPHIGIWWAQADGSNPRPFPGGANVTVHGIASDGRWAVYTVYMFYPWPPGRHTLHVLDLQSGQSTDIPITPAVEPDAHAVRFWGDGKGFWWVLGSHWSAYEYATGRLTPLPAGVVADDPAHGRLLIAEDGPSNSDATTTTVLRELDETGGRLPGIQLELGSLQWARFSPDGRWLSYQTRGHAGGGTVDALMLLAFDPRGLPRGGFSAEDRTLIMGMNFVGPHIAPLDSFLVTFLPLGADGAPAYLYTSPGEPIFLVSGPVANPGGDVLRPEQLWLGPALQVQGLEQSLDGTPWAVRLVLPSGAPVDWLGFGGHGSILYLAPGPHGTLALWSAPGAPGALGAAPEAGLPQAAVPLVTHPADLYAWAHTVALSADGTRVLAIRGAGEVSGPGAQPPSPPGLWAIRLDGTAPLLIAPDATEVWTSTGWLVTP